MKTKYLSIFAVAALSLGATSCLSDGNDTIALDPATTTDIPDDKDADPNPVISGGSTATIPNVQHSVVDEDGTAVVRLDMTGIQDRYTQDWLRLYGTGEAEQNIWVEIDGVPKGIRVYNTIDDAQDRTVPVDLVFLVDNSGSMSEEADAIARDIADWAAKLSAGALDIRFGCVGYDGAITGAHNLTSAEELTSYLNRDGYYGTSRTTGFVGNESDINKFQQNVPSYDNNWSECGMAALRFASTLFTWRNGANRIYVNFTDEPNQPEGKASFSVESLKTDWESALGTIHTVFSDGQERYSEYNYLMSQYTGGTVLNTNSSFTGVSLESLPITAALQNSYIIRFTNVDGLMDGQPHTMKVTVLSPDGSVRCERIFNIIFTQA